MKELQSYYLRRLAILSAGLASLFLIFEATGVAKLSGISGWQFLVLGTLLSRSAIVVYLVLGERLIRKALWTLERPGLNFQGSWRGQVTYQAGPDAAPSFVAGHMFRIEQDCLSIRIAPSTPKEFVNWGLLALDVTEDSVRYAYWVDYRKSDPAKFPASAKGYVDMRVTECDGKGKPRIMVGEFWHFAQERNPAFQGEKSPAFQGTISLCRETED